MKSFLKDNWIFLALVVLKLAMELMGTGHGWDLQRDEYLYLAEGKHLAWGYLEVPPTMAVLALVCRWLGDSLLVVRLIPALIGAATLVLTGKIAKELGGGKFSMFLAMTAFLFSGYLRMNLLFQPNSLEVLYFTWCAWYLIRYINRPDTRYLIYIGIILGLGMMNKYSMGLFIIGVIPAMLLTPYRKLFRNKYTWISVAIALVIFSPNLIWEAIHHFPVVHHMKELARTQLVHVHAASFLGAQLIDCLAALPVWVAGLAFCFFSIRGKPYRMIGWIYLSVIGFLLLLHGKGYYAMVCYPMLMGAGAVYLARLTVKPIFRYTLRPVMILFILGLGIRLFPLLIPVLNPVKMIRFCKSYRSSGLLRWEDGRNHSLPQDYADMQGWKELATKVGSYYDSLDSLDRSRTIIFCDNYGQSGAVDFYGRPFHLPPAQGKQASYLLWTPQGQVIHNLLLVTDNPSDIDNPLLTRNFRRIVLVGQITNPYARENGDLILMGYGANTAFNRWFNARSQAELARF